MKFKHKSTQEWFSACVYYLVTDRSPVQVNPHDVFEVLVSKVYEYQIIGNFYIVGDFKARCGKAQDFIEGIHRTLDTIVNGSYY